MSVLGDIRADLVQRITAAGVSAYGYMPETAQTPAVYVVPGSPYLTTPDLQVFCGDVLIRFQLLVFAQALDNQNATEALDELIEVILPALSGYGVEEVLTPGQMGGNPILGTRITVTHIDTI